MHVSKALSSAAATRINPFRLQAQTATSIREVALEALDVITIRELEERVRLPLLSVSVVWEGDQPDSISLQH